MRVCVYVYIKNGAGFTSLCVCHSAEIVRLNIENIIEDEQSAEKNKQTED